MRRFQAVGSRGVGAGACGVLGNAATKLVWRLCGRFDNCSCGGRGSEFQGNGSYQHVTADGASYDADMTRSWVGTTWLTTEKNMPQTGVSLGAARSRPWARRIQL